MVYMYGGRKPHFMSVDKGIKINKQDNCAVSNRDCQVTQSNTSYNEVFDSKIIFSSTIFITFPE